MKIRTKLVLGFTPVVLSLAAITGLGLWSGTQISDAQGSARLVQNLTERKVDHLRWLDALNRTVVHNEVAVTAQTDPHLCALGR